MCFFHSYENTLYNYITIVQLIQLNEIFHQNHNWIEQERLLCYVLFHEKQMWHI